MTGHLEVRVNDELLLNAGTCEQRQGQEGREILILPPAKTLFHQVLDYLRKKPDPPRLPSDPLKDREGIAAAALTLRYGSYFAVLADPNKPIWDKVSSRATSRIADGEMARINIEGSAALAEWIDILRAGPDSEYSQLVNRAARYLPMPKRIPTDAANPFTALAEPECAEQVAKVVRADLLQRVRKDCETFPTRVFANALFKTGWRDGPVENIHAGDYGGYPLDLRRITPDEERSLIGLASRRFADGMAVCSRFKAELPLRPWPEQVLPFGWFPGVAPSGWTLSQSSHEVWLPAYS